MSATLLGHDLLALAFDEAPHAVIVTNPDWRVLHWGLAAERLFGWTTQEAVGQVLDLLTSAGSADPSPRLQDMAASKQHEGREIVMRRHKGGRLMHVEVSWRSVLNETGDVRFYVASKRDVSGEQLSGDVGLIEERYRDLLDSVPDAIVIANDVGSIVLFNAEASRLFGVVAESMIGAPVERLIPERFARGHAGHRERFASQPQRRPMGNGLELRALRGDGSEFPVEVSLSPLILGERRFTMAALRDLSERARIEQVQREATSALQASSAKTEFLSRMSHELRTPLNAILGFAQLLEFDIDNRLNEEQRQQITRILRAGRHLLAMMNDLLEVTRIESGSLSLYVESVKVASILEEVTAICDSGAKNAAITLQSTVEPADLCIKADPLRLRQVLLNLVTNAIKYNRQGGRVDLVASKHDTEAKIAVSDTGIGLTRDQLSRLYIPFDRLGAETGTVEGTGIGLVIAKGLVQAMSGRIDVTSEPGKGTTFSVFLKLADRPENTVNGEVTGSKVARLESLADTPRWRMLYVEDNEANIEVLQAIMVLRPQWILAIARNEAEALDSASRERPDIALVDMQLPDTNGIEIARRWDGEPVTAGIPRAALSADATEARSRLASDQGFLTYFTKPLDVNAFLNWLDSFEHQLQHGAAK